MLKRTTLMTIIALMLNLAVAPCAFGITNNNSEKELKLTAKVKKGIAKLGVGKDSKVRVKLKDGTKVKGYVSEINENNFTVTKKKTGEKVVVPFSSVKQIKGKNKIGAYIAIGILVTLFVLIVVALNSDKT